MLKNKAHQINITSYEVFKYICTENFKTTHCEVILVTTLRKKKLAKSSPWQQSLHE